MSQYPPTPPGYQPPGYPQQPPMGGAPVPPPPYAPPPHAPPPYAPPPQGPPLAPQPRGPRRFSYFTAIVLAFFSKELWVDVGQRWRGIGLLYLLLVLLISWIILGVTWQRSLSAGIRLHAPAFVEQVPPMTLKKGVVSAQVTQPYTITNPDNGQPLLTIDTTGKVTEPPPNAPSALLTRTTIVVRESDSKVQSHSLANWPDLRIDKQRLYDLIGIGRTWLVPAVVAVMVIFGLLFRLLLMLIFGAIANAMASSDRVKLGLAGGMRLAAIAMTPAIVLRTIFNLVGVEIGCFEFLLDIGVTFVYLYLAVQANTQDPGAQRM